MSLLGQYRLRLHTGKDLAAPTAQQLIQELQEALAHEEAVVQEQVQAAHQHHAALCAQLAHLVPLH